MPAIKVVNDMTKDYNELRKRDFDSCLAEDLCATTQCATPGPEIGPAFAAQANMISGELLRGLSFWHNVMDGITMATILQIWAQHCRLASDSTPLATDLHLSESTYSDTLFSQSSKNLPIQLANHPEFIILPKLPTEKAPSLRKILETKVFHFSPSAVAALKNICSPEKCSIAPTQYSWVSTNTAFAALIWRTVIRSTYTNVEADSDVASTCGIALNVRPPSKPPSDPHMLGSVLAVSTSKFTLTIVTSSTSSHLTDTALNIRRDADTIDSNYIDSLISMINNCAAPALLLRSFAQDILDTSLVVSIWRDLRVYNYEWGMTMEEICER